MIKKLFTLFIMLAFCSNYAVFAADPNALNQKTMNAFEDNQQELSVNHPVGNVSTIEKIYNGHENRTSGNIMKQVGYDKFKKGTLNASAAGKYDSSYKLSIGEKVNILSYGDSVDVISLSGSNLISPVTSAEVGSNGSLFVPGIGPVKADGKTLGEVEKEINALAQKKYSNMKVKLQIPSGNTFSVFVYGEVEKPGKVYVSNNSSILDVLSAAGGVKKTGTLRNIKYNNKHVDLYDAIFLGNDRNIIVKANDKIFVDKIKNTMLIKNGISNPGIYEFKTGETLGDVMRYTGDLLVTTKRDEVTMISFDKAVGQKVAKDISYLDAKNTKLSDGDSVQFREMYNDVENTVTIQGNIKHPATYTYREGMRLSDILKSEDELRAETFIYQAVIKRYSGKNNVTETIPVYLKEFFAGMNDPILQPRDVITIYKNTNSDFVDVYGCINLPKRIPYTHNLTLSDIMADIQFMESDVTSDNDNMRNEEALLSQEKKNNEDVKISVSTENSNKLIPAENIAVEITNRKDAPVRIYYLYDIMIKTDKIKTIAINADDKVLFRTLRDNENIKTVKISGFVKKPGVYSFVKGKKLTDIIELAGGLDDDADLRGVIYKRTNVKNKQVNLAIKNTEKDIRLLEGRLASGYKQSVNDQTTKIALIEQMKESEETINKQYNGQIALNIQSNDLSKISKIDNIELQDGDDIYIPRISNYVAVIGEVYNEQAFVYTKGSNVKNYIKMVGGYTPNANKFRIYKVGSNGRAMRAHLRTKVAAGDTIVVPRRIAGNDWLTPISQTLTSLANIALMFFVVKRY